MEIKTLESFVKGRNEGSKAQEVRGQDVKQSFLEYLNAHPSERFWQAVRNWSGLCYIYAADSFDKLNIRDTFYWEEKDQ